MGHWGTTPGLNVLYVHLNRLIKESDLNMTYVMDPVAASNRDARLAIEMFCYSARKEVVAMVVVLGGLDMLVFTGGIGENDAPVRTEVCAALSWIGVSLDESRNRAASNPVSDGASRCQVLVLASREDEQIARHAWVLLA